MTDQLQRQVELAEAGLRDIAFGDYADPASRLMAKRVLSDMAAVRLGQATIVEIGDRR